MKAKEIIEVLEKFAPLGIQEKWDNSGLSIGSPETEVSGVLFALDCTVDLIKEAKAKGANMVVTHHPLLFHGVKKIIPGDPVADAIIEAIRSEILIYALHTPADKVVSGVSWKMAEKLGLVDIEILAQEEGGVGLGTIGKLAEPLVGEKAIVDYVKNAFSLPALRTSKPVEKVTKIAMCGGAGADFIDLARAKGAQLYI